MLMSHVILLALAPIFSSWYWATSRDDFIESTSSCGRTQLAGHGILIARCLFMATASTPRGEMMEQGPFLAILCVGDADSISTLVLCRNQILDYPAVKRR